MYQMKQSRLHVGIIEKYRDSNPVKIDVAYNSLYNVHVHFLLSQDFLQYRILHNTHCSFIDCLMVVSIPIVSRLLFYHFFNQQQ